MYYYMVTYAVELDVLNLSGNPKEFEFPIAQVREIMSDSDKIVNDFLPREYTDTDEGYETVVKLANYIAAVEVRKQWYDIGNKIPGYLKEIENAKAEISKGFPEDSTDGAVFSYSEMPEIDYIYYNPHFLGGAKSRAW